MLLPSTLRVVIDLGSAWGVPRRVSEYGRTLATRMPRARLACVLPLQVPRTRCVLPDQPVVSCDFLAAGVGVGNGVVQYGMGFSTVTLAITKPIYD